MALVRMDFVKKIYDIIITLWCSWSSAEALECYLGSCLFESQPIWFWHSHV